MPIKKSYYKSNTNINKQTNINTNKLQNKNKTNKKRKIYRKSRKFVKMKGGNNSLNLNNISNNRTYKVRHPMESFITKKVEDKYIMVFDKDNVDEIDYNNIYMDAFFQIITYSKFFVLAKEREYHISIGTYSQDYKYDLNNIKSNLHNPRFMTIIISTHTSSQFLCSM